MTTNEKINFERSSIVDKVLELVRYDTSKWESGLYDKIPEVPPEDINGNKFKGIQQIILRLESIHRGCKDPRWLTAYEAQKLGVQINKDAKPVVVPYFVKYGNERKKITFDYYNAEQCVGLKPYVPPRLQIVNEKIEKIIANSEASIVFDGGMAIVDKNTKEVLRRSPAYNPNDDKIHMPELAKFQSREDYYATVLHEIAHSTGHPGRLKRNMPLKKDEVYAMEELRAEFASLFIQSEAGLYMPKKHFYNHCAYIQSWSKKLNFNEIFAAIKDAGDIADYVRENYLQQTGGYEKSPLVKELVGESKTWDASEFQKNIPALMKDLPNWVPMKIHQMKENGAHKKLFINVNNPASGFASHQDSKSWTTYEKALEYAKNNNCDGICFAVKNSGVSAIVLNKCFNSKNGTYSDVVQNYIEKLPDTYIEKSLSGSGLHIFTKSSISDNGKYVEESGKSIEVFETFGFVPVTGKLIDENHKNLAELPENTVKEIQNKLSENQIVLNNLIQDEINSLDKKKSGYKGR